MKNIDSIFNFLQSFIENHPDFVVVVILFVAFSVFIVRDNFYLRKEVTNHLPTQIKEVKEDVKAVKEDVKAVKKDVRRVEDKVDSNHREMRVEMTKMNERTNAKIDENHREVNGRMDRLDDKMDRLDDKMDKILFLLADQHKDLDKK